MSLALRMGRTLSELRQSMTASELLMWIEFDRQSPVGDIRGDIQAAQPSLPSTVRRGQKYRWTMRSCAGVVMSNQNRRTRLQGLKLHLQLRHSKNILFALWLKKFGDYNPKPALTRV